MNLTIADLSGMKITVMGLGLNGGGLETARFLSNHGAKVTVTDLKSESDLKSSLDAMSGLPVRYVLGTHENKDFTDSDLVIKNPAVPRESSFLKLAKKIETDISLFLQFNQNPVLAITGSKGKSTTVSALDFLLKKYNPSTKLGGNITVNPLSFLEELQEGAPVVLELSSWQLSDIPDKSVLNPDCSAITNIMCDHQNRYNSMEDYIQDKEHIFLHQTPDKIFFAPAADKYGSRFYTKSASRKYYFGLTPGKDNIPGVYLDRQQSYFLDENNKKSLFFESNLAIKGLHNRMNISLASAMAFGTGTPLRLIQENISEFQGIPYRLELVHRADKTEFYNDSAATMPDALVAAVNSFEDKVILICGGVDKDLDFSVLEKAELPVHRVILFEGNASEKMKHIFEKKGISVSSYFSTMADAVAEAVSWNDNQYPVILSPGAASFNLFRNEFHRGDLFTELVRSL